MDAPAYSNPFTDIGTAQGLAETGVQGYGDALQPQLRRTIGRAIGGLNAEGALRSGGTVQALNDIGTDYGNQIGAFAKQATLDAMNTGLGANEAQLRWRQQNYYEDQMQRARQASFLKTVGSALGAGAGFLVGGPAGAATGAGVAGSVGGGYDGSGSGYSAGDPFYNM